MTRKVISALITIFLCQLCFGQIQEDKKRLTKLYQDGKYSEAYLDAIEVRKKEFGKTVGVDYIIAKSLCSLGKRQKAVEWYDNMLQYYKLDNNTRSALEKDQRRCSSGNQDNSTTDVRLDILNTLASMDLPKSTSSGKGGSVSFNCKNPPQKFKTLREIPESEMESRIFSLDKSDAAIAKFSSILGSEYQIKHSGGFLIVTKGNTHVNQQQADKVSTQLQKTLDFYVNYFGLRPPNKLITVCLLPSKEELQKTAKILHGIEIPNANWGYSNIADLSLLGWSDSERIGTLNHELFHLVVRTDIGDAPPWLDEGFASLYERSMKQGDNMVGIEDNWRTDVLREAYDSPKLRPRIPVLADFLNMSWSQFDGDEAGDICNTTINYAYGRHFAAYLQRKGKLKEVFELMKDRTSINADYEITIKGSVQVIEEALGKNIRDVETEYKKWLWNTFHINTLG